MSPAEPPRVGYVLKMYPRFSETFVVSEILAHEAAGVDVEIFSLRRPDDGRFHAALSRVRAGVTYLEAGRCRDSAIWDALSEGAAELDTLWDCMDELVAEEVGDALQAIELARLVRERRIGHLHAHFGSVATTVARLAARLAGVPYTFTAHAKDIFHADVNPGDLERKLADAAAVVTVSDFNRDFLQERYGPVADRVVRVYNGLDLDAFPYRPPGDRPRVIAAVGRLVDKKGFGDLVDACAVLAARGVDFGCRIVGGGRLEASLAAQIADLGLDGDVRLLGPRPQDEVRRVLGDAAVLAAPCVVGPDGNRDGLPTVLLEGMALGTPCVATAVTGIPELVRHAETGLLVPEHAPVALADALERLLTDRRLRVELAERARLRIEEDFDGRRQATLVRALFWSRARPSRGGALAEVS